MSNMERPLVEASLMSERAATALETTMGLESLNKSWRRSINPCSSTSWESIQLLCQIKNFHSVKIFLRRTFLHIIFEQNVIEHLNSSPED